MYAFYEANKLDWKDISGIPEKRTQWLDRPENRFLLDIFWYAARPSATL